MTTTTSMQVPRLTSLSHGGGCGCKIAPGVLAELLKSSAPQQHFASLLVGTETSDDAAVYRLNDEQAVINITDPHSAEALARTEQDKLRYLKDE